MTVQGDESRVGIPCPALCFSPQERPPIFVLEAQGRGFVSYETAGLAARHRGLVKFEVAALLPALLAP